MRPCVLSGGQCDLYAQLRPVGALSPNFSFVGRHNTLGNGQAKAVAAALAVAGRIGAVEAVKQVGELILIHGLGAGIGYGEQQAAPLLLQAQFQLSTGGRIF